MNDVSNLDILTDQIYQEGIEKAESEAKKIIENAQKEKERILLKAKTEAAQLVSKAEKNAASLQRNTEAEIRLSGEQLLSDIKNKLQEVITGKMTEPISAEFFTDTEFLKTLIIDLVKKWKPSEDIELHLAEMLEASAKERLHKSIIKELPNLIVYSDKEISGGFRIAQKNGNWQMVFTNTGFVELLNQHLRPQTARLLFEK